MRTRNLLARLIRNDAGATAIEYGLIVSLLVIAIMTALRGVADETNGLWAFVEENIVPKD